MKFQDLNPQQMKPPTDTPDQGNTSLEIDISEKRNTVIFYAGLFSLIAIIFLVGGVYWLYQGLVLNVKEEAVPVIEEKVEQVTEKKPLNKAEITFEVLNGSGIKGKAGEIAKKLEGLGYTIVNVGNAKTSSNLESLVYIRSDLESGIEELMKDINATIKISSTSGILDEGTASARIIIGRD